MRGVVFYRCWLSKDAMCCASFLEDFSSSFPLFFPYSAHFLLFNLYLLFCLVFQILSKSRKWTSRVEQKLQMLILKLQSYVQMMKLFYLLFIFTCHYSNTRNATVFHLSWRKVVYPSFIIFHQVYAVSEEAYTCSF